MPSYVVTGASRGLGYAFIKVLASNPANTVIGLARDKRTTETRLKNEGITDVHIVTADITDEAALESAASETRRILGGKGLDVLINNAAYVSELTALTPINAFEDSFQTLVDDSQQSFNINVIGTLQATHTFLPLILEGEMKKVVTISSGMGDLDFVNEYGLFHAAPYAMSKAAVNMLTAKFQASYRDQGILFLSICPGGVDTVKKSHTVPEGELSHLAKIQALFQQRGSILSLMQPEDSAKRCLNAIGRSSLEGGHGGSFLSHNGTRRWMDNNGSDMAS